MLKNVGCIPSKALLDSSHHYEDTLHGLDIYGISVENVQLDLQKLLARKDKVVDNLTGGVAQLLKAMALNGCKAQVNCLRAKKLNSFRRQ